MSIYWSFSKCSYDGCKFCSYALISPKQIPTKESVVKDLDADILLVKSGKQRHVKIFNSGSYFALELPKWVKEIVKEHLINADCKKLRVENYYDRINYDEVQELIDLGFDLTISWGLEIANNDRLKFIGKNTNVEDLLKVMTKVKLLGAHNLVYVLAGLPGIPYDQYYYEYVNTINWVSQHHDVIAECSSLVYTPMRFTVFHKTLWLNDEFRIMDKHIWKMCKDYSELILQPLGIKTEYTTHQYWIYSHGKTYREVHPKGGHKVSGKPSRYEKKTKEERQQEKELIKESRKRSGLDI